MAVGKRRPGRWLRLARAVSNVPAQVLAWLWELSTQEPDWDPAAYWGGQAWGN